MYDVVIVGGSFAGLATAMQLRGRRVLVIDQRPIGSHQTSTCAIPVRTARALGTESAALEEHPALVLHTGGREIPLPLREPFLTFDYHAFCQALLAQTDAEVRITKATGYAAGQVLTSAGPIAGRFVVDASGWQGLQREAAPARAWQTLGYGVETELPARPAVRPGLHFYFEKRIVRNGYGWVFPCGPTTRIGVCSFDKGVRLGPQLDAFLTRFGLVCGTTHGGVMSVAPREPVVDGVLRVGDSAGQCLAVTAEGIRTALYYAQHCGRLLAAALAGRIGDDEARRQYAMLVRRHLRYRHVLLRLQAVVARTPEPLIALAATPYAWRPLGQYAVGQYLARSGGLVD